jgi:quaternary ammonium compound-resistance protein SugE
MAWFALLLAGLLEIVWAYTMKRSEGFTRPVSTLVTIVALIGSLWLLSVSMKTIPLGTAYAIWTGIGALGAFVVGVAALGETISAARVVAVALLLCGLALLKLTSA